MTVGTIKKSNLRATPLHLKEANDFVRQHHRHSIPTVGGKFAVGVKDTTDRLIGVAIAGRPVARMMDNGRTLEVLRVATDGTFNANSFLYRVVVKIARAMGYGRIITYTLDEESGASLKAVGAVVDRTVRADEWDTPSRRRKSQPVYQKSKLRWVLT